MPSMRLLTQPAALILLAANAVPLLGILIWKWDAFLLLLLYWMETAIIGFWTLWLIAKAPGLMLDPSADSQPAKRQSTAFLVGFLAVHAGIFMTVHFFFLWMLFSGQWSSKVHDVAQFASVIVIGQGLWLPLLILFVARGIEPVLLIYGPDWYRRKQWEDETTSGRKRDHILLGFYGRIIVMQFAIILSGFVVGFLGGAIIPLLLLIVIKTAIDLGLFLKTDFDAQTGTEKTAP